MRIKAIMGILLVLIALLSGCGEESTTGNAVKEEPSTVNKDVVPQRAGCGDGICDADERCDETSHRTVCPEDCGITCGSYVKLSEPSCEGSCSVSGNEITVTGDSKIKITLENLGERATSQIKGHFKCEYASDGSLYVRDGSGEKNGYTWEDYFEGVTGNKDEVSINSAITGNNEAVYIFSLKGNTKVNRDLNCRNSFSSTDFDVAKSVKYTLKLR